MCIFDAATSQQTFYFCCIAGGECIARLSPQCRVACSINEFGRLGLINQWVDGFTVEAITRHSILGYVRVVAEVSMIGANCCHAHNCRAVSLAQNGLMDRNEW